MIDLKISLKINGKRLSIRNRLLKLLDYYDYYTWQPYKYTVNCYCGESLKVENEGETKCLACGDYISLSGTVQTSCGHKCMLNSGDWVLSADFDKMMAIRHKKWKDGLSK